VQNFVRQLGAQQKLIFIVSYRSGQPVDQLKIVRLNQHLFGHVIVVVLDLLHSAHGHALAEHYVEQVDELRRSWFNFADSLERNPYLFLVRLSCAIPFGCLYI
jgi:hypothetical protein